MHLWLDWLRVTAENYESLKYVAIFLVAAFGGEPGVIACSFIAAQGFFPLVPFVGISFLGVLSSDSLYFFLGKTQLVRRLIEHRYAAGTISAIMEAIERLSRGRHMVAFILAKFVIGTRAVIIMYISKKGLSFGYFLRHNLLAIITWLVVVISIGYLAGLGFSYISKVLENIYAGIGFLVLALLVLLVIQAYIKKRFEREETKIENEAKI